MMHHLFWSFRKIFQEWYNRK